MRLVEDLAFKIARRENIGSLFSLQLEKKVNNRDVFFFSWPEAMNARICDKKFLNRNLIETELDPKL